MHVVNKFPCKKCNHSKNFATCWGKDAPQKWNFNGVRGSGLNGQFPHVLSGEAKHSKVHPKFVRRTSKVAEGNAAW